MMTGIGIIKIGHRSLSFSEVQPDCFGTKRSRVQITPPRPPSVARLGASYGGWSSCVASERSRTKLDVIATPLPIQIEESLPGGHHLVKYVYLLRSISQPTHRYVGTTDDLKKRLETHNAGGTPHTAKYRPWQIVVAVRFQADAKATAFEKYLKSGSGHAFANKHFW